MDETALINDVASKVDGAILLAELISSSRDSITRLNDRFTLIECT